MQLLNDTSPQVHRELIHCNNCIGDEGEESDQDENQSGVCCKGKGLKDGKEHKGGKNQGDDERDIGMCTGCCGEEKILVKFEDGQKKDMISCSLVFLCLK